MSGVVGPAKAGSVSTVGYADTSGASPVSAGAILPQPTISTDAAMGDAMSMLYALTSKQRDRGSANAKDSAELKGKERQDAFQKMQDEIAAAKKAQEDSGWLSAVTKVLDSVTDAVVGGNPLQDVLKSVDKALGTKALEVAYDFVRPDAILNAAVMATTAVTGQDKISQAYDVGAGTSSLKTRFEGVANASGHSEVMDAYALTRQAVASAMITVGTCGTGTAAVVAMAMSTALTLESKFDLLGKAGLKGTALMAVRIGTTVAASVVTGGVSAATGASQGVSAAAKGAVEVIQGTDTTARGAVTVGQSMYDHATEHHMAQSVGYEAAQHRADRQQDRIISGFKDMAQTFQATLETISSTWDTQNQTSRMLATRVA